MIDSDVAIEIKSAEEVLPRHLKGLKAFGEEHPEARRLIVSLDPFDRSIDGIECLHVRSFFKQLWDGNLF